MTPLSAFRSLPIVRFLLAARAVGSARAPLRGVVAVAALGAVLGASGSASARPEMPGALRDQADMPCPPSCGVCHVSSAGGGPRTRFGVTLQDNGLSVATPDNLTVALGQLRSNAFDSDDDGQADIDELVAGTDPNGDGSLCGPEYGCARVEPRGPVDGVASVAAVLTALGGVLLIRRRRG